MAATAATSEYGSTPSVDAGTVTGFVNSETTSVLTGTMLFSTTATSTSNVGSYAIDGSGLTANHGNYVFAQAAGNTVHRNAQFRQPVLCLVPAAD